MQPQLYRPRNDCLPSMGPDSEPCGSGDPDGPGLRAQSCGHWAWAQVVATEGWVRAGQGKGRAGAGLPPWRPLQSWILPHPPEGSFYSPPTTPQGLPHPGGFVTSVEVMSLHHGREGRVMCSACWLPTFGVTFWLTPTHPGSPHEPLTRPSQASGSNGLKSVPSLALRMPEPGTGPGGGAWACLRGT